MPSTPVDRRSLLAAAASLSITGCFDDGSTDGPADEDADATADGDGGDPESPQAAPSLTEEPVTEQFGCSRATRPTPDVDRREVTLETGRTVELLGSIEYPALPDDLDDDAAVTEFVEEHERAYRRNAVLTSRWRERGLRLDHHDIGVDVQDVGRRDGHVFVLASFTDATYWLESHEDAQALHGDGWGTVVYVLDDTGLVRQSTQRDASSLDDDVVRTALEPDEWNPLVCRDRAGVDGDA